MYKIKYKHKNWFFWKTKIVVGHGLDFTDDLNIDPSNNRIINKIRKNIDAMIFYFEDGSVERVPEWSKYQMKLGIDWKLSLNEQMEKETGQKIRLERGNTK